MNEEIKKPFDLGPILPMFGAGFDLGERLGAIDSRLKHMESGQTRLETRIDVMEARLDARMDTLDARIDAMDAKFEAKFDALDAKFEAKFDAMDAKFEAMEVKTDKMAYALNRLDERTKSMQNQIILIGGGIFVAVVAGIVLQYFK